MRPDGYNEVSAARIQRFAEARNAELQPVRYLVALSDEPLAGPLC